MKHLLLATTAALCFAGAASASPTTITFESGTVGAAIGSDYTGLGAVFTDAYYAGYPSFAPSDRPVPDPDPRGCTGCKYAIGLHSSDPFKVTFTTSQSTVSFFNIPGSFLTATAYDSDNHVLQSLSDVQGPGSAGATRSLSADGDIIKYVVFSGQHFGIDDLGFNALVPEPAAWAMIIGGFGIVGGTLRYRRRRTTVTYA